MTFDEKMHRLWSAVEKDVNDFCWDAIMADRDGDLTGKIDELWSEDQRYLSNKAKSQIESLREAANQSRLLKRVTQNLHWAKFVNCVVLILNYREEVNEAQGKSLKNALLEISQWRNKWDAHNHPVPEDGYFVHQANVLMAYVQEASRYITHMDEALELARTVAEMSVPITNLNNLVSDDVSRDGRKFFGRETDLEKVRDRIQANRSVQIVGRGGLGKTALVHRLLSEEVWLSAWDYVIWFDAKPDYFDDAVYLKQHKSSFADFLAVLCEVVEGPDEYAELEVDDLLELLDGSIDDKKVLCVLDNWEALNREEADEILKFIDGKVLSAGVIGDKWKFIYTSRKLIDGPSSVQIGGLNSVYALQMFKNCMSVFGASDKIQKQAVGEQGKKWLEFLDYYPLYIRTFAKWMSLGADLSSLKVKKDSLDEFCLERSFQMIERDTVEYTVLRMLFFWNTHRCSVSQSEATRALGYSEEEVFEGFVNLQQLYLVIHQSEGYDLVPGMRKICDASFVIQDAEKERWKERIDQLQVRRADIIGGANGEVTGEVYAEIRSATGFWVGGLDGFTNIPPEVVPYRSIHGFCVLVDAVKQKDIVNYEKGLDMWLIKPIYAPWCHWLYNYLLSSSIIKKEIEMRFVSLFVERLRLYIKKRSDDSLKGHGRKILAELINLEGSYCTHERRVVLLNELVELAPRGKKISYGKIWKESVLLLFRSGEQFSYSGLEVDVCLESLSSFKPSASNQAVLKRLEREGFLESDAGRRLLSKWL